jgi:hypothetical protein
LYWPFDQDYNRQVHAVATASVHLGCCYWHAAAAAVLQVDKLLPLTRLPGAHGGSAVRLCGACRSLCAVAHPATSQQICCSGKWLGSRPGRGKPHLQSSSCGDSVCRLDCFCTFAALSHV